MSTVLVISSSVSASRVGASASAYCLQRLGHDVIVLPTTLLGRHPGWGPPGGGPISIEHMSDMWIAIAKQNIPISAVLTGYMTSIDQVKLSARIIDDLSDINRDLKILVDPVMGDHGQLYIKPEVAVKVAELLVPRATIITPNAWELSYLSHTDIQTIPQAIIAAHQTHPSVIVTSIISAQSIGALHVTKEAANYVCHQQFEEVPHGGGDALAGLVLAHSLSGLSDTLAMQSAVSSVFDIISAAVKTDAGELPLIREQDKLVSPKILPLRREAVS